VDPPKQSKDGARVAHDRSSGGSAEPICSNCKPMSGAGVHSENSCQSSAASAVASKSDSAVNHMELAEDVTGIGNNQDYVKPSYEDGLESTHTDTEIPSDEIIQDGWSCLKYIEVDVEGLTDTVIAVNDSGYQLCAVNAETVRSLDLPVFGHVKLKGISDRHMVPVDVVKIRVRLTTGKKFVNITCAIVEKLNYPLILGSDIVDKLNKQFMDESFVANEMMNAIIIIIKRILFTCR